jgi:hypothetical protein
MNNYMLLGTSRFVFIVFYLLSSPKLSWSAIFPHLENLQLSLRCSVFFILLTSCKCDSRLGCLLTFPWKQWWHMLFNSFSDMTLMVCVETIVIKPRNISRKLVKQTYEVCPSREGYYHYNYLYKWLIYPNTLQYKAMNKQVVEQELIIIKQNAAWYPYTLVKKRSDAMIWCSIFLT